MQAAGALDELDPRPQRQVIAVAEQDVGAALADLARQAGLDRGMGADRHEGGQPHVAVRRVEHPGAGVAVGGGDGQRAHAGLRCAVQQSMQSPKLRNR